MASKRYPRVKRYLGEGCSKVCYSLSKTKVAVLADYRTLHYELQMLRHLKKRGVPVPNFKLGKVIDECGELSPALVGERFDFHTFRFSDRNLTKKQKKWLFKLRKAVAAAGIDVTDPQFLGKRSGKVVLCDPGALNEDTPAGNNNLLCILNELLVE